MASWQVGDVRITQVVELSGAPVSPRFLYAGVTKEQVGRHAWLRPHYANDEGKLFMSIHAFVVESEGRRIIVDTCVGNDKPRVVPGWNRLQGPFLTQLAEAGFPPESIDTVLCTHMHVDHVGWNTRLVDGAWVPTFANARYLFARKEWEHFADAHGEDAMGDVIGDSVRPILDAGLADLVEDDHPLTREVWLEPTPGHTPGHVSVRIRSQGGEAVITGDLMHHPIQCCEPDLNSSFDMDPEQAKNTRRAFLERYGDRPVLVLGTHFAPPTAGWLVTEGDAWRLAQSVARDGG